MRSVEDIKSYLSDGWKAVQEGIRSYLGTDISLLNTTNESLLENSGKQIRPMIALLVAGACPKDAPASDSDSVRFGDSVVPGIFTANADSVRYAVASELLHNATLLHDDVADESDWRRGKPTLRSLMGPEVSVLVGDFWLVRAVKAILDSGEGHERVVGIFAQTLSDLAEGEMLQLEKAASCDTSFEDYLKIIYRKTASLFVAACRSAAISVHADNAVEAAVADYGKYIGYAFQMRDDIFDYMQTPGIGKPVGVDILERKITLPLLSAFENVSSGKEKSIRRTIMEITPEKRDDVLRFVRENGGVEKAQNILEEYSQKAVRALDSLPWTKEREMLCSLATYIARRDN